MLEMEYQREGRDYSDGDPERLGLQRGEDGEDLNVEYYGKDFEYYYKIAKQSYIFVIRIVLVKKALMKNIIV